MIGIKLFELSSETKFHIIVCFTILRSVIVIGYNVDANQKTKRMELEICLDQFDIHRDTIIRTEESLSVGGRYLQGVNIETPQQCQHLCCETVDCDVFVFEEKKEGFCYLFDCGTTSSFKCKFTKHANYTSAVYTPILRSTAPTTAKTVPAMNSLPSHGLHLEQQAPFSQHELELTNLKQKSENDPSAYSNPSKLSSLVVMPGFYESQTTAPPTSKTIKLSLCKRFQFQCHTGECIAVYNACDGIPQCKDGSDEGPECLVKDTATEIKQPNTAILKNSDEQRIRTQDDRLNQAEKANENLTPKVYLDPVALTNKQFNSNFQDGFSYNPETIQSREQSGKIFNHKGGLKISDYNEIRAYPPVTPNLYDSVQKGIYVHGYKPPTSNSYTEDGYKHQAAAKNWQRVNFGEDLAPNEVNFLATVDGQPVPHVESPTLRKSLPTAQSPATGEIRQNVSGLKPSHTNKTTTKKQEKETLVANNGAEEYVEYKDEATELPKKQPHKHRENNGKENEKIAMGYLKVESIDHDGIAERPGGAVLSLTLGLILTAALVILMGCRLRVVNQRSRRVGKTQYAHDADFLVNGMYL